MDKVKTICDENKVALIEDCAHTMGSKWRGIRSGNFGSISCFSTQTYKHLNSGEGGLLTSNDEEFMARAIIYSGSYMLYERHGAAPSSKVFEDIRLETPNYSGRMDNLRASILRPQLKNLEKKHKKQQGFLAQVTRIALKNSEPMRCFLHVGWPALANGPKT